MARLSGLTHTCGFFAHRAGACRLAAAHHGGHPTQRPGVHIRGWKVCVQGAQGLVLGCTVAPLRFDHSTAAAAAAQVETVRPGDKAVFTGMLVVVPDVAALT